MDWAREIELVGVVTQPDRAGHRGRLNVPAVKRLGASRNTIVLQPRRLSGLALDEILELRPDALVWAAYGNLIPRELLAAVHGRALNVHASLLPRWRGPAPVAWAILAGDRDTGVTLMEGSARIDEGRIVSRERTRIIEDESAGELETRLAHIGGRLLRATLPRYLRGEIRLRPQPAARATWAPKLESSMGELDFRESAVAIQRRIRAFTPEPGAYTYYRGQRIQILDARRHGIALMPPGTLRLRRRVLWVATRDEWLLVHTVLPAGRRAMSAADWGRSLGELTRIRLPT